MLKAPKPTPPEFDIRLEPNVNLRIELGKYKFPETEVSWGDILNVIVYFLERKKFLLENCELEPLIGTGGRIYWGSLSFRNLTITSMAELASYKGLREFSEVKGDHLRCEIPFHLSFEKCNFEEGAYFGEIDFRAGITLKDCSFSEQFDFLKNTAPYESSFEGNYFHSITAVVFEDSLIDGSFKDSYFASPTSFEKVTFRDYKFSNTTFSKEASFYKCLFSEVPDFSGSSFHDYTTFYDCAFVKSDANLEFAQRDANRFRTLKNKMLGVKEDREAVLFHSLELSMRHRQLSYKREFFEKTLSLFYGSINEFGWSISLPLKIIASLWISYAGFLFFTKGLVIMASSDLVGWELDLHNQLKLVQSLFFSLKTVFPPLVLFRESLFLTPANIVQQIIRILVMAYASIVWTMLIFSIRRRFKLF